MTVLGRLRGEEAGPPVFAPRVTRLAAHLEQVSADQMANDPGVLARTLCSAQRLLKHDAVALDGSDALVAACRALADNGRDAWSTLDADAFVRTPRWGLFLEAIARVRATAGTAGVVVLLPGPCALAGMTGTTVSAEVVETAGEICAATARTVAGAGISAVMITEADCVDEAAHESSDGIRSVCTILRYYRAVSAVCVSHPKHLAGPLAEVGADIFVVPAMESPLATDLSSGVGLAIPPAWFSEPSPATLASIRTALKTSSGARLVTTLGELSEATKPEGIRRIAELLYEDVGLGS
jgi:hypothetical protein